MATPTGFIVLEGNFVRNFIAHGPFADEATAYEHHTKSRSETWVVPLFAPAAISVRNQPAVVAGAPRYLPMHAAAHVAAARARRQAKLKALRSATPAPGMVKFHPSARPPLVITPYGPNATR